MFLYYFMIAAGLTSDFTIAAVGEEAGLFILPWVGRGNMSQAGLRPELQKTFVLLLAAVMLVLTSGPVVASGRRPAGANDDAIGGVMPQFSLPSALNGAVVSSDEFKGKVVLVVFFATWCPPCLQEIPSLISLQEEYGVKGFSVVGLSVDKDGPSVVRKLINKTGINYPVLMADSKTARGFGGISGIPVSFLVDRQGIIRKKHNAFQSHAEFERDIKDVLH